MAKAAMHPKVAPAGKFAAPVGCCDFHIRLRDQVLFDFDTSEIRPDAATVLDAVSTTSQKVTAKGRQMVEYTQSNVSDDHGQRAQDGRAMCSRGLARMRRRARCQSRWLQGIAAARIE